MSKLGFGQPLGALVQFAYLTEDIERGMLDFAERLGVGPWFVRGPFTPPDARYRGKPSNPTFSVARAFSGHAMVELIQQHDRGPSVFNEHGDPTFGFHHWAQVSADYDADIARYRELGYEEAFYDRLPSGSRVSYMDSTPDLPGMLELVEYTEAQDRVYTAIYEAAIDWDGRDPIRRED